MTNYEEPCPHCGGNVYYYGIVDGAEGFWDEYHCEFCDFGRTGPLHYWSDKEDFDSIWESLPELPIKNDKGVSE